jgi:hypothetical protein
MLPIALKFHYVDEFEVISTGAESPQAGYRKILPLHN